MCLFFGSHTTLAVTVLRTLLDTGAPLQGVVVPHGTRVSENHDPVFPIYHPHSIYSICETAGVPVFEVDGVPTVEFLHAVAARQVRFIVCVCFPLRLPKSVLSFPRVGCLNLHPSCLPAYRGPAPTFWQLRSGEPRSAVTLHHMNKTLDAGDIVAQAALEIPIGISANELDHAMAVKGAALIRKTLTEPHYETHPQDEDRASYFSWPQLKDFTIETSWSAERVFRFMRGTREMGQRYAIKIDAERFLLHSALMYSEHEFLGSRYKVLGSHMRIQFAHGVVDVAIAR